MSVVIITGSAGLVGSEAAKFYCQKGYDVIGIDNNSRRKFFGKNACTNWKKEELVRNYKNYKGVTMDKVPLKIGDSVIFIDILKKPHMALVQWIHNKDTINLVHVDKEYRLVIYSDCVPYDEKGGFKTWRIPD